MKKILKRWAFYIDALRKPFLIMRWSLFLFIVSIFQAEAISGFAQKTEFSLSFKNASVAAVLSKIEDESNFYFMCNRKLVDLNRVISIQVENQPLEKVLAEIFRGTSVEYVITGKQIVLAPRNINFQGNEALQQSLKVSGLVTDSSGQPLPGSTVLVKGTTNGTITDAEGKYSLSNVPSNATLLFSFVGMKSVEIPVSGKTTIDMVLKEETIGIEEVVAVGYGSVKKSDLTSAVGVVEVKTMAKAPVASFSEALAGRVAGVQATSRDGQPGSVTSIVIRGTGSLTQSTSPLYVIDGFPVEDLDPSALNPEEIESMSILKDASSTAIYGSRAANGVILINTKRGKVSKPIITLSASRGYQNSGNTIKMMTPYEFVQYNSELNPTNAYIKSYFADGKTLEDYRNVKGIDWTDKIFRTGVVDIYNLAIRGGTVQTRYSISGSLHNQEGVVVNTGQKRYNGRITLDQDFSNNLKAGITVNYSRLEYSGQQVSAVSSSNISSTLLFRTWAYRPVSSDASVDLLTEEVDFDAIRDADIRVNPLIDLRNQNQITNRDILDANGYISYELLTGLTLKITGGARKQIAQSELFFNSKTIQGNPRNPTNTNGIWGYLGTGNTKSWSNEYILNYKTTFGNDHSLTGLALFGLNKYTTDGYGYYSKFVPNESLGVKGLDEGIAFDPRSYGSESSLSSYATRWDYSYKSKYIFSGTFRADGSSKFSDKNKWGYFPGLAVAWNMEKENFFKALFPFISSSKLRFSYGSNGNNRVDDFARFAQLKQDINGGFSFHNQTPTDGVYVSSMANDDLKWEITTKLDIGYELGLFDKRVNLELDLYRNTTTDLLLNTPLPPTTGFSSTVKNIGSLKNEGLEIALNTVNVQSRSFRWTSNFNISFNKNTIIELTRGQRYLSYVPTYTSHYNTPLYISEIGKSTGMMYGYVWDGNYQYDDFLNPAPGVYILKNSLPDNGSTRSSIQPGDIKYKDLNGDGVVNTYDKTIIGRGQPIHTGGFTNNFMYKQFTLNILLQWSYGNNIYNANRLSFEGNSNGWLFINQYASYADRWSPDNQDARNFRTGGAGPVGFHSSRVVEDGSYLRLKTVSLDYDLPRQMLRKLKMKNLTLNFSAQNLLTWTNYSGLDPEVSVSHTVLAPGFDYSAYPQAKTVVFGIKATF